MKKKLLFITLATSALTLLACSPNEPTSSSSEAQLDWTSEDVVIMENVLGEGNALPFYDMFPVLAYEVAYEASCDYVVISATSDNEDYADAYVEILKENDFTLVNDDESYHLLEKTLSSSATKVETQFAAVYIEGDIFTVDSYVETVYTTTSWPSNPSVEQLLDVDFINLPTYSSSTVSKIEYTSYVLNYNSIVRLTLTTSSAIENESFVSLLENDEYKYDANKTTAFDYSYYKIGIYDEEYDLRYAIDATVSKECTTISGGYTFDVTFSVVLEF